MRVGSGGDELRLGRHSPHHSGLDGHARRAGRGRLQEKEPIACDALYMNTMADGWGGGGGGGCV